MNESEIQKQLTQTIPKDLDQTRNTFTELLGNSVDLQKREFEFQGSPHRSCTLFYMDGLVNTMQVESVLKALMLEAHKEEKVQDSKTFLNDLAQTFLNSTSVQYDKCYQDLLLAVTSGDTVLLVDQCEEAMVIGTRGWEARSVEEPATENVVRGPRDGFTESIRTNTALVRRRIRDPLLRIQSMKIGKKTRTDVNLAYIEGTVKEGLVEEVKQRLSKIEIDAVLESGYIEELIEDNPLSPFATLQSTERPDKVAAALLEGRVAIFVDNTPFVIILPVYFWQYLQASDDYYSRYWVSTFFRIIRYGAFMISLTFPSIYVMLISFHHEMIPTGLALTIASGREIVPFPVLLEALLMEFAFELMREAGLRMPKPVGQAVSIVGSLIIGQAAVQAGLVSPFMVIVVAVTGISSFAIPNYAASFSIRIIRFPLLVASGTLGLLGFATVFFLVVIHALSLRSFGEPYLAPAAPFRPSDQKDTFMRLPWWKMNKRPSMAQNDVRVEKDSKPSPDSEGSREPS